MGNYPLGVQKDEEGRYKIAVGSKIVKSDYKDSQRIWGTDFEISIRMDNRIILEM